MSGDALKASTGKGYSPNEAQDYPCAGIFAMCAASITSECVP